MTSTASSPYKDRFGHLNDAGAREIARRLRAGENPTQIARGIGMHASAVAVHCRRIGPLIGVPSAKEKYLAFCEQVCGLAGEGLTDREIAAKLGCSKNQAQSAREKLGHIGYRVLRLTAEEKAEIDRRLIAGEITRDIAAAVGCTPDSVWKRKRKLTAPINPTGEPCECGKPKGHKGLCGMSMEKQGLLRERLAAGAFAQSLAKEFGAAGFTLWRYAKPIIAELTAQGITCRCGQPLGHRFSCTAKADAYRNHFTAEQVAQAREAAIAGTSAELVKDLTGLTLYGAQQLLRKVRAELAAEGVPCGCGKPMDHNLGCTHRLGKKDNSAPRTTFGAAGRSMAPATRWKVVRLVREGWNIKAVCDRTGESEWRVTQVMNDVLASGAPVSPTCPKCGQTRNHRGPCLLPEACACGRRRNHRGPCRTEKVASLPAMPEEQRIYLWQRYNDGLSIRRMSERSGVPFSTVQRAVKFWNERRRTDPRPCACGRPFRHPGGCIKNTPAALDGRWIARIEEMVREGSPPSRIARDLDLTVATVQKHSLPLRMRLFDEGIACACGRPLHHNYWCSAKWDQYGMRRGFRPLPAASHAAVVKGLLAGAVVAELAKQTSVHEKHVWAIRRELSSEDQRRRRRAVRERMRAAGGKLDGRAVLKLIEAALPKGLERALRDDVAGELQLAVMEGRIEVEQIRSVVRSFVRRGLTDWANQYGPRSLDEKLSTDGTRTLGDLIEDVTTTHHLEEISIGEHEE